MSVSIIHLYDDEFRPSVHRRGGRAAQRGRRFSGTALLLIGVPVHPMRRESG
nr:hypothetical protein [Streptomyces chartreusis]